MSRMILTIAMAPLLCGIAFAAGAQNASVALGGDANASDAQRDDGAAVDASADRPFCLRETGSQITTRYNSRREERDKQCVSANGRAYSREDIERTGETDLADALRKLDTSIR